MVCSLYKTSNSYMQKSLQKVSCTCMASYIYNTSVYMIMRGEIGEFVIVAMYVP